SQFSPVVAAREPPPRPAKTGARSSRRLRGARIRRSQLPTPNPPHETLPRMPTRRVLAFALTCATALPLCAGDTRVASLLDEAERIHAADKARSRRLLGDAERALANDPALTARARLLECKWAD